jgi:hypothetical protein
MADIEETGVLLRMNSSSSGGSSIDSKGAILTSNGLGTGTFDQRYVYKQVMLYQH